MLISVRQCTQVNISVVRRFLTTEQVAEITGISKRTLEKWRGFPGMGPRWRRLHGAVRYDSADIDAWLDSCPAGGGERSAA
jgi:predicted DNA-binding transcriptional regulator AlpA